VGVSNGVGLAVVVGVGVKSPERNPTDPIQVPQVSCGGAAYSATIQMELSVGSTAVPL